MSPGLGTPSTRPSVTCSTWPTTAMRGAPMRLGIACPGRAESGAAASWSGCQAGQEVPRFTLLAPCYAEPPKEEEVYHDRVLRDGIARIQLRPRVQAPRRGRARVEPHRR